MVFALNFCLAFLARDRCSSKAIPEIILDFFFFFFETDWAEKSSDGSRQRGNESLMYAKLPLVWRVADVWLCPVAQKSLVGF